MDVNRDIRPLNFFFLGVALFFILISFRVVASTQIHNNYPPVTPWRHWSVFAGIGYINYLSGTQNQLIDVTPYETDLLVQFNQKNNVGSLIGFTRTYLFNNPKIQGISITAAIGYNPVTFSGQVYQGCYPLFNNYTYIYDAQPIDVDAETQILLPQIKIKKIGLSPYALLGGGMSTVNLMFQETAQPGIPADGAYGASAWMVTPLAVFGGGLQWDIEKNCFIRTEYRYDYRGNINLIASGIVGNIPVNLNEQMTDILFGYRFQ